MDTGDLSIYRPDLIRNYFDANVRKPGWRPWFKTIQKVPEHLDAEVHGIPVKLNGLGKMFRSLTETARVRFAAYKWLYPSEPLYSLDGLDGLLVEAGLNHLVRGSAAKLMVEQCHDVARDQRPIQFWTDCRVALLEFEVQRRVEVPEAFPRAEMLLRKALLGACNRLWLDPEDALNLASETVSAALNGAAQAAHDIIGIGKGQLNASLMMPVADVEGMIAWLESQGVPARQGHDRASELWKELAPQKGAKLMVVAETVQNEHVGFWVPVVDGNDGRRLPGAPEAFAHHSGSAVFKRDLPNLSGFPDTLNDRWRSYVKNQVSGRLFVSLPLMVPRSVGAPLAVAVLNVNADTPEWCRALHPEWLLRAQQAVRPFVEIAFYATLLKLEASKKTHTTLLDTGAAEWNLLPGGPFRLPSPKS